MAYVEARRLSARTQEEGGGCRQEAIVGAAVTADPGGVGLEDTDHRLLTEEEVLDREGVADMVLHQGAEEDMGRRLEVTPEA
jgi:hypothetical protein